MDNLKYYNDSLAYDFETFMPREKRQKPDNVVKMPQTVRREKTRRNAAAKAISVRLSSIVCVGFLLAAIGGNILLRAKITETKSAINKADQQISQLEGEISRLNVELERRISYENIEAAAQALGMRKMDKSQVVYIRTHDKQTARTADGQVLTAEE